MVTAAAGSRWDWVACPACHGALAEDSPDAARCSACAARYPTHEGILDLRRGAAAAPAYDPHYFTTLPFVEERHFWFVTRRAEILAELRRTVHDWRDRPLVDVGCGSGGLLAFLARSGVRLAGGCDAYLEGLRIARRRISAPIALVEEGAPPPLAAGRSMVALFDVLEHIDDDVGTLRWLYSVLRPGGVLVLTVPAHPFLFDEMDELARHRRRYTRLGMRSKLEGAGFEVIRLRYFMAVLVPAMVAARAVGRLLGGARTARERRDTELRVVPGLNGLVRGVLAADALLGRVLPLPFGSSLLAIARRPVAAEAIG